MSICLSPDSISFWMRDRADLSKWGKRRLISYEEAFSGEVRMTFDPEISLTNNIERSALRVKAREGRQLLEDKVLYLDTPKVVVLPEEHYQAGAEKEYLLLHNMVASDCNLL